MAGFHKNVIDDSPKLQIIMDYGSCKKHHAERGEPCWALPLGNGRGFVRAVCNRRAKTAGFNAPISSKSLWEKRPMRHGK